MSTQRAFTAIADDFQIRLMFASKCCANFLEYTLAVFTVLQHQHPICVVAKRQKKDDISECATFRVEKRLPVIENS